MTQEVARRFQQMAAGKGVHGAAPARKSSEVQAPRAAGGAGKGSAMVQGMATGLIKKIELLALALTGFSHQNDVKCPSGLREQLLFL